MDGRTTQDERRHLFERRCVSCGHDGPEVQVNDVTACPVCGCDLVARPPMSYAEMEGISELTAQSAVHGHVADYWSFKSAPIERGVAKSLERWLLFLFMSLLLLFGVGAFASILLAS